MSQRAQLLKIMRAHTKLAMQASGEASNNSESQNSIIRLEIESNKNKPKRRQHQCWLSPAKKDTIDKQVVPVERLICVICRLPVRGLTNMCLRCNHGGHALHMQDWFAFNETCPRGCGCVCITRRRKVSNEEKQSIEETGAASTVSVMNISSGNSEFRGGKINAANVK